MSRQTTTFTKLIAAMVLCAAPHRASAQGTFEYAGKIVCGVQADSLNQGVVRGFYATVINVRNPGKADARIVKTVQWTLPPGNEQPVPVRTRVTLPLTAGLAFATECAELVKRGDFPAMSFHEGFIIISSTVPLDVVGLYTAAPLVFIGRGFAAGHVSTMHVERFPERRM